MQKLKKIKVFILIFIISIINFYPLFSIQAQSNNSNLNKYLEYFYNRYSKNFDEFGLVYAIPEYGIKKFTEAQKIREWISLVSYYKYRALNGDLRAQNIIRFGILKGYNELLSRGSKSQSFQEAEAHFLTIQILEKLPYLIDNKTKTAILNIISNYLEDGLKAPDTENRAIIASAHWQYINNYLFQKRKINFQQKEYFDKLLKIKIDRAIKNSINKDAWYFENQMTDFSVHYHTVSAFMLMIYGDLIQEKKYLDLAQKMYLNIKKISFSNGFVEAQLGHRPLGLGAQFYLMQGLLGEYFDDSDSMVYLFHAQGNTFFSDIEHPNRLEFHSTIKNSSADYHDDYAFSDVAELGLSILKLKNINLYYKASFDKNISKSLDHTFSIYHQGGKEIIFNKQKNILDLSGNYSKLNPLTNNYKLTIKAPAPPSLSLASE